MTRPLRRRGPILTDHARQWLAVVLAVVAAVAVAWSADDRSDLASPVHPATRSQ